MNDDDVTAFLARHHRARIVIDACGHVRRLPHVDPPRVSPWLQLVVPALIGFVTAAMAVSCGLALVR